LFPILFQMFEQNANRSPNNFRYSPEVKDISFLMWFYAQGVGYSFLSNNLAGILPSSSSLHREKEALITAYPIGINEDSIKEAKTYFESFGYSDMMFTLSEDSTAIIPGVQWYEKSDSLIGIITPNGSFSISATSYNQILTDVENSYFACDVHVYLLNPLVRKYPSFVIAVCPSNKKETADDLLKRWKELELLSLKYGIKIVSHASDGESKQLRAMREYRQNHLEESKWEVHSPTIGVINSSTIYKQKTIPSMLHPRHDTYRYKITK
jgi:hypothetical protein